MKTTSWWQTLLMQLPSIIISIATLIGSISAYNASKGNAVKLEQHTETLQKVEKDIGQVNKKIK